MASGETGSLSMMRTASDSGVTPSDLRKRELLARCQQRVGCYCQEMPDTKSIRLTPKVRAACAQAMDLVDDAGTPELTELAAALLTLKAAERNVLDTIRALRQMPTSSGQIGVTPTMSRDVRRQYSWQDIANVLGVTRQTAHERFVGRLPLGR